MRQVQIRKGYHPPISDETAMEIARNATPVGAWADVCMDGWVRGRMGGAEVVQLLGHTLLFCGHGPCPPPQGLA